MQKVCAVIVAAGKGKRMGTQKNKQFLLLKGKPVLFYTLKAFSDCPLIDEIILVTGKEEIDYCKREIVEKYSIKKILKITAGGSERQQSVYNGLCAIDSCDTVLIHDGARPFVTDVIIENGIKYANLYGASACGMMPKDTIKVIDKNRFSLSTPDRKMLFSVQTPQCFDYNLILNCHKKILKDEVLVTDDTMAVEIYGHKVFLYEGSYSNIKITSPEDLLLAEVMLQNILT
jgi:2-C-methyl-D-erythritol 4-phosphate cytidylyltransferase